MEELIMDIKMFKQDHPEIKITDEMIKDIMKYYEDITEDYKDKIIEEIREEIGE